MRKFTMLIIAVLFANMTFAQITSTTAGGDWNKTSTWIGGVLPTANDDVIIDGTVYHNNKSDECQNITINSGKTLTSKTSGWPLNVWGDLINNGNLQNNDNFWLQITAHKNITNNGVWTSYGISLSGDSDQTIVGTKPFAVYFIMTQKDNSIIAGSDLSFLGTSLLFYKNNEFVIESGKTVSFSFSDAQVRGEFMPPTNMATNVQFTGGGTVCVKGKYNVDECKFEGITLTKE